MTLINISDESMELLRRESTGAFTTFHNDAQRAPGGGWLVDIPQETAERFFSISMAGETADDTMQRILRDLGKIRTN